MMNRNILNPMMWTTGSGPTPPTPTDGGIYWNSSLGLISLSGDGENWITIADKNLGASQVYNYGDERSQTNSGNRYQRGNNYGFPFGSPDTYTGTIVVNSTDTTGYGPGNYYNSNIFYCSQKWSDPVNTNLWGGQSIAPIGYHIPTRLECQNITQTLGNIWTDSPFEPIDISNGACMKTYLKMPYAGQRDIRTGNPAVQTLQGLYWTNSFTYNNQYPLGWTFSAGWNTVGEYYDGNGFVIRCVKDTAVAPDSSWIELVQNQYAGGGVYHNPSLGLISLSSDGTNWITIQDKNLGATVVYNDGDNLSEANCGKYYQRGNCYGFPFTGGIQTYDPRTTVNGYGPGNYYSSSDFINFVGWDGDWGLLSWYKGTNNNLWGGVTNTDISKKGPCGEGYHICSSTEARNLGTTMRSFGLNTTEGFERYLFLPGGNSWTATNDNGDVFLVGPEIYISAHNVSDCYGIRPFKNEPVAPDDTWTKLF